MATSKKGSKENPVTEKDVIEMEIPEYVIVSAKLNDGKCDFSFRTQKGVHEGEVTNTKGAGWVLFGRCFGSCTSNIMACI